MGLVHEELSYEILGALFDVYNEIGPGHREHVYQKAVAVMFKKRKVVFEEQVKVDLWIADEIIGTYYLDFLVAGEVIVELKSRKNFRASDFRQTNAYLKTLGKKLAILATFAPEGVRFRRVLNLH